MGTAALEDGHARVGGIGPDGAEGAPPHVAEAVLPGKLVRMHVAERVDGGDANAGLVAAVPGQEAAHLLSPLRLVLPRPQVEVGGGRGVVDREGLLAAGTALKIHDPLEE